MRRIGIVLATVVAVTAATLVSAPPSVGAPPPITRAGCGWQAEMSQANPPSAIRGGVLSLPKYAPVSMPLAGDVNWLADPYHDPTWRLWFHSLKWMEGLVRTGDPADMALARAIVTDFVKDNPDPGTNTGAWVDHATSLRTSLLVCMWEQGDADLRAWIEPIIAAHTGVLVGRWVGLWNHGLMQNLALLGAGCTMNVPAWRTTASARLDAGVRASVDAQGAMNEQGLGYVPFIQSLLREVVVHLEGCGMPVPAGVATRVAALDLFAAEATRPNGTFVEVGDTYPVAPGAEMGPYSAWVSSGGAEGRRPAATTKVYGAGWIFGRDSWVRTAQQYSLRFGPGRWVHGHNDHLSMTYWAQGRDVLVDAGFSGYADADYRDWQRSPQAHNVPVVLGARFSNKAATSLVGTSAGQGAHSFSLRDSAYAGAERFRTVLVDDAMRMMLVRDDVTSGTPRALQVLWHLDPSWRAEHLFSSARSNRATFLSPDGRYRATVLQIAPAGTRMPNRAAKLVRGRTAPLQGFVARGRGDRTPAWVVEARRPAAKRQSVVTLVVVTPVAQQVDAVWTHPHGADRIRVTVNGHVRVYDSTRRGGMSVH
ncbi:MAG TPA: heparinase II/III family protein [Sporichthya sp.]|nr:heparinase II/III family protein [Sporichthya sp.]